MAPQKRIQMDNICRNCGKAQPAEELVTCQMCHKASEHLCCMKSKLSEVPAVWYCEECAGIAPSGRQNASKRLKTSVGSYFNIDINKSLSKQTPPQDFSGRDLVKKSLPKTRSGGIGRIVDDTRKTMGDQKRIYSQDGSTKTPDNHKVAAMSGSSNEQFMRTLSHGISYKEAKTSKTILLEEATPVRRRVRSGARRILDTSFRQNDQKNVLPPLTARRASVKEYHAGSSRVTQVLSKSHMGSAGADVHSSRLTGVAKGKNISHDKIETTQKIKCLDSAGFRSPEIMRVGLQKQNLPLVLAIDPDGKVLNGPASQGCWKGTFEVLDVINIQYSEIQAYFPHMVCSKVYEISRHLPEKIKFRLLPLRKVWPRIFQADPPTKDDVGLYFSPCEEERHKERYVRFIERLQSRSLAMQTSVNGVHLLLFTSKQLPLESQGIDAEIFMWGIFCNMKSKKHNQDAGVQSHVVDVRNKCAKLNVPCDEIVEEVDMEIDMMGGKDIGRIDLPIKRMSWSSGVQEPNARDLNCARTPPLKKVTDLIHPDVPAVITKLKPPAVPELPSSELQSSSSEATPKKLASLIHPDAPTGFVKLEPSQHPQVPIPKQQSLHGTTFKEVGNPIIPDKPPGFGNHEPLKCPELLTSEQQSSSPKARSKEVVGLIYPDVPPGFAELGPPGFAQPRASKDSKQQSLPGAPSKGAVRPIHPQAPPGFDELRRPGSLQVQAPKHENSSSMVVSKASVFSRMDVIGNLTARNGRDHVATAPESRTIQSKHFQASDLGDKSAKYLGSSRPTHHIEYKKGLSSFGTAVSDGKSHSMSNNIPSSSTGQKGCRPTVNLCHPRPSLSNEVSADSVTASKASAGGFSTTTFCSGTPKEESHVDVVSMNASSYANEKGEADLRTGPNKLVTMAVELVQESDPQNGGSKMQERNTLAPGEQVCQHTKENEKVQIERKGNSLDNQLALAYEDHKSTSGSPEMPPLTVQTGDSRVQRSRIVVSHNFAYDEDNQCREKTQNREVMESTRVRVVSDSRSSISVSPRSAAHVLKDDVQKGSLLSDNLSTEEEMEGVEKIKCSSKLVPKKQIGLAPSVCETETSSPGPELPDTSKDPNEKGRGKEVEFFGSSSKEGMEGMENSYEMLDLNNVPNWVSKVSSVSDTQSSTLQPPLRADHIVSDEAQKKNLASVNFFTEDTIRTKRECKSLSENKPPDLIILGSDSESSSHALPGFSTEQDEQRRQEEKDVSECTSKEVREARENTESCTTVDLNLPAENYNSPACSPGPIISPITPALQLFPEAVETISAHEVEGSTELGIGRSVHLVSTVFSLSRPQYVRDGNTWIPKSTRERLQRDGCGKELRLSF